ncbi:TatD family hydrolase [Ammoniphilus sp. CFH 90114]|uniref:TatD family hydrolase n=1 Tax=Ammoniphilus sp. CFH 90114 TaxID=2493665 RepID=UPI00100DB3A8|nr:TatD family hydrolase [Ammoniphilus sp. CFH 90114]RXT08992.1 TatD family deoxyribonuclease [Ammoniphilus sp. CFH 90114]
MLFDTHAHLNAEQFQEDQEEVIRRAKENGVSRIVNIGFNRETIPTSLALAKQYDFIYTAVGWHPQDAKDMREEDYDWLRELSKHEKVVAIGEIGLDYYWDTSPREIQQVVFRRQIQLARELKMPIIIHNRDAHQDVVDILKEEKAAEVGGIMHCFSGSLEMAKQCLDMNFYISFGGPVTFKNAKKPKEIAQEIPLDRLLIETDCPYLTPEPYRGKRNESGYVRYVAETIAALRGMSVEELAQHTTNNAKRLFNIQ